MCVCVFMHIYMYYMCLLRYSDRPTFWSKHNPKGGSTCLFLFFYANQYLEPPKCSKCLLQTFWQN